MTKITLSQPIPGYTKPGDRQIAVVSNNKVIEELVMRIVDAHRAEPDFDQRLVSIAATHFMEGFMALNRAVFQPQRLEGPLDLSFLEVMAQPK
jgi:hypothetical protein